MTPAETKCEAKPDDCGWLPLPPHPDYQTTCKEFQSVILSDTEVEHLDDLHERIRALETERDGLRARCEALAESVANSENWTGDPARKEERASFLADLRAALDGERKP